MDCSSERISGLSSSLGGANLDCSSSSIVVNCIVSGAWRCGWMVNGKGKTRKWVGRDVTSEIRLD